MNIGFGVVELLVSTLIAFAVLSTVYYSNKKWLLGLIPIWIVSTIITPADPMSLLLVAIPCSCLYIITMLILNRSKTKQS